MTISENGRQLSFKFNEPAPCFELSCKILEQENIQNMLPFTARHHNDGEEIIFSLELPNIVHLSEVLDKLGNNDIIDLLYELFFVCEKIEENGFLKKECVWYKYEHIFYDLEQNCPMLAIFPITGEFRYSGGLGWGERLENTVARISEFLSAGRAKQVIDITSMFAGGHLGIGDALDGINRLGAGTSDLLVNKTVLAPDVTLKLLYVSRSGELVFDIKKSDFVIGKDGGEADGIIPDSISKAVSRRHCNIIKLNDKYFVQDLDSTNHTFVNGGFIPAYEIMELADNDIPLPVSLLDFTRQAPSSRSPANRAW